jgi:hypothetical protein
MIALRPPEAAALRPVIDKRGPGSAIMFAAR